MSMKSNTITLVPLDAIAEDPRNFYETEGGTDIEKKNAELIDSIRADGLIHAVTIRPSTEEERAGGAAPYTLISGHRRFIAFKRLAEEDAEKFGKIPAVLKRIRDDLQGRLMLLEANTTARDVSDWEKAQAVKEYGEILDEMKANGAELEGRRRDHIAAALGMSKTNVGRFENINKNLSEPYRAEFKAGKIGVSVADKLASLPDEQQQEMHETNPTPKLGDFVKEKPIIAPVPPEPTEEKPVKTVTRLNIPEELGGVTITVVKAGGKFASGYEALAKDGFNTRGARSKWEDAEKFDSYDAAFEDAVARASAFDWINDLLKARPEEHNSNEEPEPVPTWDDINHRLYAISMTAELLRKKAEQEKKLADVCLKENDGKGAENAWAAEKYLRELLEYVNRQAFEITGQDLF